MQSYAHTFTGLIYWDIESPAAWHASVHKGTQLFSPLSKSAAEETASVWLPSHNTALHNSLCVLICHLCFTWYATKLRSLPDIPFFRMWITLFNDMVLAWTAKSTLSSIKRSRNQESCSQRIIRIKTVGKEFPATRLERFLGNAAAKLQKLTKKQSPSAMELRSFASGVDLHIAHATLCRVKEPGAFPRLPQEEHLLQLS